MNCVEYCKFNAIDKNLNIIKESCEGCKVCEYVCPTNAIYMVDRESGVSHFSDTRFGSMSHAFLNTAEEASGKLVTVVRNDAISYAKKNNINMIIIDGPPGIGCPVISSITGVDIVLIVTEPTLSAIHDLERIHGVANHFKIPAIVCINKYDINLENTENIEKYCKANNIDIVGKLPYDNVVPRSMVNEKTIIEFSNNKFSKLIVDMWNKIEKRLNE
jgi:MinD superfamily P-loop ATPase